MAHMASLAEYHHRILAAADRVADAVRTEDRDIITREITAAVCIPVPDGGPQPWTALVTALAVQVDTDVPWRERFAWTLEIPEPDDIAGAASPPRAA